MKNVIDVVTGKVKVGRNNTILMSSAIGSCVAVVAIDIENKIGGIAHVMLPGAAPVKKGMKTKYAFNALDALFKNMLIKGAVLNKMRVFIVGGASMLGLKKSKVGEDNTISIIKYLKEKRIRLYKKNVGGNKRMSVRLDINKKIVSFSEGGGPNKILWRGSL